jgi:hypothetical protein
MNEMDILKFTFQPLYAKEERMRCLLNSMIGLAPIQSRRCTENKNPWSYRESNPGHLSRCLFVTPTELRQILEKYDNKIKNYFITIYIPVLFIPSVLTKNCLSSHMLCFLSIKLLAVFQLQIATSSRSQDCMPLVVSDSRNPLILKH